MLNSGIVKHNETGRYIYDELTDANAQMLMLGTHHVHTKRSTSRLESVFRGSSGEAF